MMLSMSSSTIIWKIEYKDCLYLTPSCSDSVPQTSSSGRATTLEENRSGLSQWREGTLAGSEEKLQLEDRAGFELCTLEI